MKTVRFLQIGLLLTAALSVPRSFAQDYTRWGLPEGAKARLGKGWISGNVAYSQNGQWIAVGSSIGVWLYDANSGAEANLFEAYTRPVRSVAFSPDDSILAAAQYRSIDLWDTLNRKLLRTIEGAFGGVECVAFSPDGLTLASGAGTKPSACGILARGRAPTRLKGIRMMLSR